MPSIEVKPLPKSYTLPQASGSKISAPVKRNLLSAGPAYLSHLRLTLHHNNSFEEQDAFNNKERRRLEELQGSTTNGEDDLGVGDEPETEELLSLDPKEWKKHDYYAVLGLSHLRYKATPEQIKIAHRKKVLKHHPDKKVTATSEPQSTSSLLGLNLNTNDDAFFKCIQKAHEVLTNPEKRRQFDSVDPEFIEETEAIPSAVQAKKLDFFKTWAPVFEREARFSRQQPVPMLGNYEASKEHVEGFYDFWYKFDSWRSFEWLDKEVNEGSDNRDDKRYTEKKNKSERARRKKEDTARLRQMVDLVLSLDPRIKRIKEEEKAAREAKRLARSQPASGTNTGANTPKKSKTEEEEEKRKKEEAEKAAKTEAKKAKAAAANAAKKARRQQRAAEAAGDAA
ncbi:ribosome associated chaperone [Moniliophthora roreri MCA 2997]|uniref:Ribosome associated chaperone n=2 Tax=Moniliophthora roreri TaxID=221103 RepID=V2YM36_MONRO|nr:ribosome associated chaperone [Moniliophthora roreri MCA 2997]KAI3607464.1 ribosome associated chaperone [Moniliophthora roreri]